MSFELHERYQAHCQHCGKTKEGDSATEAILGVEEHERGCPKNPHRLLIESQIKVGEIFSVLPLSAPSLCIHAKDAREVLRITPEGEVIINPEFTPEGAAREFWDAVQKIAAEHRARGKQ